MLKNENIKTCVLKISRDSFELKKVWACWILRFLSTEQKLCRHKFVIIYQICPKIKTKTIFYESQKTVVITFPAEDCAFAFLGVGDFLWNLLHGILFRVKIPVVQSSFIPSYIRTITGDETWIRHWYSNKKTRIHATGS